MNLARTTTLCQVPRNQTFKFINQGEFGDRIIEYDASYRVIRNEDHIFLTRPFRLCFYNTTPDAFIFAIRAGLPNDESLMRWVWDTNRDDPVHENATFTFGRNGNLVLAEADGRVAWQTKTANKGSLALSCYRMATAYELVLTINQDQVPTSPGNRRLLQAYTYYDQVSYLKWEESFAFFSNYFIRECALPSKCGTYGLCDKRMCVACPSPNGLLGWSESCTPKPPPCGKRAAGKEVDYYNIVGVEHFLNPYMDQSEKPMKVG
ncbi:hypothetical protein Dsin_022068 [Dipteronia sinensis]|uniref:Bulb-type lectin domain-containing protein n=1 Tax=Dipteronia sinensis TaxID=43782 RepID=A0AAE0DZE2_9ROSI|nr:hypothetical protein Dsin_022068 [Dipteronia sinensis]